MDVVSEFEEKIRKFKREQRIKLADKLNKQFAGKYISINWYEEGSISMKIDKIEDGYDNKVIVKGLAVGDLELAQHWKNALGIETQYYIDAYSLVEHGKEITKEQFITDCKLYLNTIGRALAEHLAALNSD